MEILAFLFACWIAISGIRANGPVCKSCGGSGKLTSSIDDGERTVVFRPGPACPECKGRGKK